MKNIERLGWLKLTLNKKWWDWSTFLVDVMTVLGNDNFPPVLQNPAGLPTQTPYMGMTIPHLHPQFRDSDMPTSGFVGLTAVVRP